MITLDNVSKYYGNNCAVDGLSLNLEKGKIYGLLGPNGAGKTTTINMIVGYTPTSTGSITIDGLNAQNNTVLYKKKIGYLPEIPPLYPEMTPREFLQFVTHAKKAPKNEIDGLLKTTATYDVADKLIKNLSKGYRQRIGIAAALVGSPPYIILDEPMVGLDPAQIKDIRNLIKSLKENHTVILSSHILSEISAICDEIIVLSKGTLVAFDKTDMLEKSFFNKKTLSIEVKTDNEPLATKILNSIEHICVESCNTCKSHIEYTVTMEKDAREQIFFEFANQKLAIIKMQLITRSLEDIFIELTTSKEGGE